MKDLITRIEDKQQNNMLHIVSQSAKPKRFQTMPRVAFQMQREFLWFEEVEKTIPHDYRYKKNIDGQRPQELFTMKHEQLVNDSEFWMKHTSSHYMVGATLIATIAFATIFSLPGGTMRARSLPKKLVNSLATLFLSIVTMMVAFSSSFYVLYDEKLEWVAIMVTGLAGIPVILFAILHFRLLWDALESTYQSRFLFKLNKRILYY
ncbi:putative PGG domain-containing protein [Helianthus anomalus]